MSLPLAKSLGFGRTLLGRVLHLYFLMTRGLTLGVRAIVRSADGKFLLVRHTYTPGWHFPGGGVEKGETAERALRRELRQETGLSLSAKPALQGVYHNTTASGRDHVLVYFCETEGQEKKAPDGMEIAELGYYDLETLPDETDPGTVRRMREVVEGVEPGDAW